MVTQNAMRARVTQGLLVRAALAKLRRSRNSRKYRVCRLGIVDERFRIEPYPFVDLSDVVPDIDISAVSKKCAVIERQSPVVSPFFRHLLGAMLVSKPRDRNWLVPPFAPRRPRLHFRPGHAMGSGGMGSASECARKISGPLGLELNRRARQTTHLHGRAESRLYIFRLQGGSNYICLGICLGRQCVGENCHEERRPVRVQGRPSHR